MARSDIPDDQIEEFDRAFHKLWFKIMIDRPESKSKRLKGLSFMDTYIINLVYENPDVILKDIREKLKIPQTTLSSIVAKLHKRELLERVINPRDYRSFSLKITPQGKKMMDEHTRLDYEQNRHILESLEPDERKEFITLFTKVADKFNF